MVPKGQYGLKLPRMVPNGPKWSKIIYHKFNWMAFITRFNLDLAYNIAFEAIYITID